jgi:hypothetical protein
MELKGREEEQEQSFSENMVRHTRLWSGTGDYVRILSSPR